jgi:drug/metabolite transporter (DMT)-like permease
MPALRLGRLAGRLYDNAYLLLIFTALFWAGNQVLGRAVVGQIPPILYSFLRWLGAMLLILPFAWPHLRRDWPNIAARWRYLVCVGIAGGGMFNTLQYVGLNYTTAINSLVLNSTAPIFIGLACFLVFRDKITAAQMLGTLVSTCGVLAIVAKGEIESLQAMAFNIGDLLILLGMATNGFYTAYLRERPAIHWLSFLFCLFAMSTLFNLPLVAWELSTGATMDVTAFTLASVAYVAVAPSILAYIGFTRGVELIGGVRASIFLHLIPVFGAALAIGILGEPLGVYHIAGFALILAGVTLASRNG